LELHSIEELFFIKLKEFKLYEIPQNQIKWDEFIRSSFSEFENNPRFELEKNYFHNFIKKFSKKKL